MNLEGYGSVFSHPGLGPAGALLVYAQDVLKEAGQFAKVQEFRDGESLLVDPSTQRNLEIFKTRLKAARALFSIPWMAPCPPEEPAYWSLSVQPPKGSCGKLKR